MSDKRQLNSTAYPFGFLLVLSSDKSTPYDGLAATVTVTLRKPGGSFGAVAGAVSKIANGWYELAGNATDRNTMGEGLLHIVADTCDPQDYKLEIVGYDPFAVARDANVTQVNGAEITPVTGNIPADLKAVTAGVDFSATMKTSITTAATASLDTYDPPTKAELDTAMIPVAQEDSVQAVSANVASVLADTNEIQAELADGGRTDLILDAILAASGGGSGAIAWVHTVTDSATTLPIAQCQVWATTDAAGSNIVASGYTDNFGAVTFNLDAGTYYFWHRKSGYSFASQPDSEAVA